MSCLKIREYLIIGDLDRAQSESQRRLPDAEDTLATRQASDDAMRAAMIIAEIRFAFGSDVAAQALVKGYAESPDSVLASSLDARQKLQLAEYHYSLFETKPAISIASAVLKRAEEAGDRRGVGECRYYLTRASLRMNEYEAANEHCMRGLEVFHRSDSSAEPNADALTWQTGRLLRVRGTAMWWQERLTEATAVLYLAVWLLRRIPGSRIQIGDALDSLGRILRSQGSGTYREAIDALEGARRHYRGHDLKLARTLTDLARTRHNMGLQQQSEGIDREADSSFGAARANLREALDITDKHCVGADPPIVWRRQKLDVLVGRGGFIRKHCPV
jgi:tetratricopeptide (TPR) repeat protein